MPILLALAGGVTTLVPIELLLRVLLGLLGDVRVAEGAALVSLCFVFYFGLADEEYALYPRMTFSGSRPSLGSRLRLRARGMACVC